MKPRAFSVENLGGFTLIEVMAATAISSILLAAIGSLLLGSFEIIKLIDSRKEAVLEEAVISLETLAMEIQKAPVYQSMPLEAGSSRIKFTQLVSNASINPFQKAFRLGQVQEVALSGTAIWIKKVEYAFDESQGVLIRKLEKGETKILARHLKSAQFFYALGPKPEDPEASWEWKDKIEGRSEEMRLKAMRIVLTFDPKTLRYVMPGVEKTFLVMRNNTEAILEKPL